MKPSAFILPVLIGFGSSLASALDFVRQIQVIDGATVVVDMDAANSNGLESATGEVTSSALVASNSVFQLWAAYTQADNTTAIIKLDEKSVGTYLPTVSITTSSEDPFVPTCTRADRPYSYTISVSGMLTGATDPGYTKTVLTTRGYKLFSPVTQAPSGVADNYSRMQDLYANGTYSSEVYQQLPGASPTAAMGAENITAWIQPAAGSISRQLAVAEVLIWPVASATITGITEGERYLGFPQSGVMTLVNLYPRSTTYAQIYKGRQTLGTTGTIIPNTITSYGAGSEAPLQPQSTTVSTISLDTVSDVLKEDGVYTIEILTVTPFNNGAPERLAYVTFDLDRTITVTGTLTTLEE